MAVTDEAITKLKQMIMEGELRPGARLPREPDLARRLGLSRNSLREAVKALSLIHVLDVRQGDGTYVTSLEPSLLLDAMAFVVDFHQDDTVLHFLEVRRILEPAATAMAATAMPEDEIAALQDLLDKVENDPSVDDL
ncbi:MAG TPA: GntR family transcriptional regulator, partial [Segeticoccus sp.]|uniref:FadR/GntR family transcriptional regulator n=1 Tax=Segeticoccus sp. TaxID=2706531 RepID=UPI002D7E548E